MDDNLGFLGPERGSDGPRWIPETLKQLFVQARESPSLSAILLFLWANGYFLNARVFGASPSTWLLPELGTGLIWACFVATLMLAATGEFIPPTRLATTYVLLACLVESTGSLGIVMLAIAASKRFTELAGARGLAAHLLPWCAAVVVFACFGVPFFRLGVKSLRRAIRRLGCV